MGALRPNKLHLLPTGQAKRVRGVVKAPRIRLARQGSDSKSKASSSKPTAERRKAKEDGKELAPAQNTVTSSKTLQARVDSIRSELLKPQVSSESGAKAYTLLRDLLSYAMRCESNRV
jgi:hypothetical protein